MDQLRATQNQLNGWNLSDVAKARMNMAQNTSPTTRMRRGR
ncbi:hypothetical protein WKI13_12510 [Teredinibacter turnerae]|nr:hypothetical protein [Teredinibacter turnerae]